MTNPSPPPGDFPSSPPPGGNYPSPPEGGYPAPPPPGGAYAPPPPGGGYVQPGGYGVGGGYGTGPEQYTAWFTRVLAWLIDWAPVAILSGIGSIFLVTLQKVETVCVTDGSDLQVSSLCVAQSNGPTATAWAIYGVLELISLAYLIWNLGLKQGNTGSSVGKGIMKFKVVGEETGQPIGFGKSFVRELIYIVAYAVCFVPWLVAVLFPLWDQKRQSLVDKLIKTVCVPL